MSIDTLKSDFRGLAACDRAPRLQAVDEITQVLQKVTT